MSTAKGSGDPVVTHTAHLSHGPSARCSGKGLRAAGHTLLLKTKAEQREKVALVDRNLVLKTQ